MIRGVFFDLFGMLFIYGDIHSIANLIVDKWQEQISLDADAMPTIQQLKKPDPNIFEPALTETKLNANEVAYVGDTQGKIKAISLEKILQKAYLKTKFFQYCSGMKISFQEFPRQFNNGIQLNARAG